MKLVIVNAGAPVYRRDGGEYTPPVSKTHTRTKTWTQPPTTTEPPETTTQPPTTTEPPETTTTPPKTTTTTTEPPELPLTGGNAELLAGIGFPSLLIGVALLFWAKGRRRRDRISEA